MDKVHGPFILHIFRLPLNIISIRDKNTNAWAQVSEYWNTEVF